MKSVSIALVFVGFWLIVCAFTELVLDRLDTVSKPEIPLGHGGVYITPDGAWSVEIVVNEDGTVDADISPMSEHECGPDCEHECETGTVPMMPDVWGSIVKQGLAI